MKKLTNFLLLLVASCGFLFPGVVLAQTSPNDTVDCTGAADSAFCRGRQPTSNPLFGENGVLTRAAAILALVTGVISLFIMTIAGLRFITSGGDPQKVTSARQAIVYATIGIAVAISAQAIVTFVLNRL